MTSYRAATILRLLGNETIQFNTRGKKSEPGLRKIYYKIQFLSVIFEYILLKGVTRKRNDSVQYSRQEK